MGEAAKPLLFDGFQTGCNYVLRGKRGTSWHPHVSAKMSREPLFVASAALWGRPSSFYVTCVLLRVLCESNCRIAALPRLRQAVTTCKSRGRRGRRGMLWHAMTLHTLQSTLYTLHSTLYTVHSTLYTPHFTLHTLHSTLYTPHFTLYTLHVALYTPHFTLYTLHSALHNPHFSLYTPHSPLNTPLSSHLTLCSPPSSGSHSLQRTGTVTGKNAQDCPKHLFHKGVLRDCIRVRGLHLVLLRYVAEKSSSNRVLIWVLSENWVS